MSGSEFEVLVDLVLDLSRTFAYKVCTDTIAKTSIQRKSFTEYGKMGFWVNDFVWVRFRASRVSLLDTYLPWVFVFGLSRRVYF